MVLGKSAQEFLCWTKSSKFKLGYWIVWNWTLICWQKQMRRTIRFIKKSHKWSFSFQVPAKSCTNQQRTLIAHISDEDLFWLIFINFLLFRTLPSKNLQKVAEQFTKYNFQGLLVIGGFEVRPNTTELHWRVQPRSQGLSSYRPLSSLTGLNNVCACTRSHGSRCRQQTGHHNKPRKNGGVFKSFVWCPVYGEKGKPDWKREKEIFTLVPSTIGRHIPFCTLGFKACTIGENSA